MQPRRFQIERDLDRLEAYLREQYLLHRHADAWLPERLHDLIYRVSAQEADEGRTRSADYIFLWEEDEEICACVLPDGENIYVSIRDGFAHLFPSMVRFSETHCRSLFPAGEDGSVKLWFAVSDSFPDLRRALEEFGYREYPEKEYMICAFPLHTDVTIKLPEGYQLLYGEDYPEEGNKWSALRLGFHPEYEAQNYKASMHPYDSRKKSRLYKDSFECIVVDDTASGNNVCAYCFVYVDHRSKTAMIEPVSTREKYRHQGIGTAMLHGAVKRCKELGVEKCYVDAFGQRKDFYVSAGFHTENSISFWFKTISSDFQ